MEGCVGDKMKILHKLHKFFWDVTLTPYYKHGAFGFFLAGIGWVSFGNLWCLLPPIVYGVAKETWDCFCVKKNPRDHAEDIASYAAGGVIAQLILYWKG